MILKRAQKSNLYPIFVLLANYKALRVTISVKTLVYYSKTSRFLRHFKIPLFSYAVVRDHSAPPYFYGPSTSLWQSISLKNTWNSIIYRRIPSPARAFFIVSISFCRSGSVCSTGFYLIIRSPVTSKKNYLLFYRKTFSQKNKAVQIQLHFYRIITFLKPLCSLPQFIPALLPHNSLHHKQSPPFLLPLYLQGCRPERSFIHSIAEVSSAFD